MLGYLPTDGNEALFQQPQEFGDLAGFLAAFGLALRPAVHERIDHVSCECEFLAFLACKEACALDVDPLDCDHRQDDVPMWEMKTGTVGSGVNCSTTTCSDPHDGEQRVPVVQRHLPELFQRQQPA